MGGESHGHVTIRALDCVTLDVPAGERLGLLGHNGSGKSTLLKVMAGVYHPTIGSMTCKGRITSLLDLTLGMELEATGYENIFLRGALLGVGPREIKKMIGEIADFSGLEDYLKLPIRTYSSGMLVRLGFAISTAFPADIILMDEWLGVGDADFQASANARLQSMADNAAVLVLASHSPELIEKTCTRCIRLEHGKIIDDFQVAKK